MKFWWIRLGSAVVVAILAGLSVPATHWWLPVLAAFGAGLVTSLLFDLARWSYSLERNRQVRDGED